MASALVEQHPGICAVIAAPRLRSSLSYRVCACPLRGAPRGGAGRHQRIAALDQGNRGPQDKKSELGGRQIALIAMAVYADQQAVAAAGTSSTARGHGPRTSAGCSTSSSPTSSPIRRSRCSRRSSRNEDSSAHSAASSAGGREEALVRLDQIDERIAELDGDALARVEQDIGLVWTGWNPRQTELRDLIRRLRDAVSAAEMT